MTLAEALRKLHEQGRIRTWACNQDAYNVSALMGHHPDRVLWYLVPPSELMPGELQTERRVSIEVEWRLQGGEAFSGKAAAFGPQEERWDWAPAGAGLAILHPREVSGCLVHHAHEARSYHAPTLGLRFTVYRAPGCPVVYARIDSGGPERLSVLQMIEAGERRMGR